jgi:hypothetical protein
MTRKTACTKIATLAFNDLHDFLCTLLNYIDSDIPLISFISLLTSPLSLHIAFYRLDFGFKVTGNNTGLVWFGWLGLAWLGISGRHLIIFSSILYLRASSALISHAHISWLAHSFVLFLPCPFSSCWLQIFFYLLCAASYYHYLIVLYSSLPSHQIPCSIYTYFLFSESCCSLILVFMYIRMHLVGKNGVYLVEEGGGRTKLRSNMGG